MPVGTIKRIMRDRGFGFITPEKGVIKDIFFHMSALEGVELEGLTEGDNVVYEAEQGAKGPQATVVRRAERE